MNRVAIVTDTTACIPKEQVKKCGLEIVPVLLVFGEKTYRDGIDISPTEFYKLLRETDKLPTTSASSPDPYINAFRNASRRAQSILCLTEPSRFTAMYNAARVARETVLTSLPDTVIEVLECTTAAAGLGLTALAAARAAEAGKSLDEVLSEARQVMSRVHLYATLDTLHYLVKGGRVPQAAALINSLLKIKPVFTIDQGDAHTVALPRTIPGAVKRMLQLMEEKVVRGEQLHAAVMHAAVPDKAAALKKRIAAQFDDAEIFITEFTPVMGVHTGPGLLGIAFYSGN